MQQSLSQGYEGETVLFLYKIGSQYRLSREGEYSNEFKTYTAGVTNVEAKSVEEFLSATRKIIKQARREHNPQLTIRKHQWSYD